MRYNFHLTEILLKRLRQRAKRDGVTVAELIRQAIVDFLKKGD